MPDMPDAFAQAPLGVALAVDELLWRALREDIGRGDVTSEATVPAGTRASARILARQAGTIAGLPFAVRAFSLLDPQLRVEVLVAEGAAVAPGTVLATLEGEARAILAAERTALNLLGRLAGIATLAAHSVAAVRGTRARILDTRKTTPGLRALEKYAVRMGGAENHRAGLDDGILIKDNHIVVAGGVRAAVERARAASHHLLRIEVECEDEQQVADAVEAGADVLLLDNMPLERLREAVAWVRSHAPLVRLEASGGIGTDAARLAAVAATGVDYISLGALTHSAAALDVSLDCIPHVAPEHAR